MNTLFSFWQPISDDIWQGRDDSQESPEALRLFQTVICEQVFNPDRYAESASENQFALLGFMSDEGVRLNQGRVGARDAPNAIRKALANLAASPQQGTLIDFGNTICPPHRLEDAQAFFSQQIQTCHASHLKTVVLGGGHETAFAHGLGVYHAYPDAKIGVINFDAHLDVRTAKEATSGTPFKQLAAYCQQHNRIFEYLCVGASLANNTQALWQTAKDLNASVILDTDCSEANLQALITQIQDFIQKVDIIYLTIDLDVLSPSHMFAVSAPAALGIEMRLLLQLTKIIAHSPKLKAFDVVEYNPHFDTQGLCAKVAARIIWNIYNEC